MTRGSDTRFYLDPSRRGQGWHDPIRPVLRRAPQLGWVGSQAKLVIRSLEKTSRYWIGELLWTKDPANEASADARWWRRLQDQSRTLTIRPAPPHPGGDDHIHLQLFRPALLVDEVAMLEEICRTTIAGPTWPPNTRSRRCGLALWCGKPGVIATRPRLPNGTPFPTTYCIPVRVLHPSLGPWSLRG